MGQYYAVVNLDAKETISQFDFESGVKLTESCYVGNAFVDALSYLLEIQVGIAIADEVLDQGEHERLLQIAAALGVSINDMERLIRIRFAEQQFTRFSEQFAQRRQRQYEQQGNSGTYHEYGNHSYENYEKYGYALYKMRKFEEYSLYLDNKRFLGSESVLTFQGFGGKLMALKPDVTLSIVKNARVPEGAPLKLYYRESVYRTERGGGEFKEIHQMGVECIGALTASDVFEVCSLAVRSLALIDEQFIFSVSHMG